MTTGDQAMRELADSLPVPEFDTTAFTTSKPLAEATVALVTTAAIHTMDDEGFTGFDTGFRLLDRERRDLALGHWSPNFDRSAFAADLDVVYPIDRLEELAADGIIPALLGLLPFHQEVFHRADELGFADVQAHGLAFLPSREETDECSADACSGSDAVKVTRAGSAVGAWSAR